MEGQTIFLCFFNQTLLQPVDVTFGVRISAVKEFLLPFNASYVFYIMKQIICMQEETQERKGKFLIMKTSLC